MGRATMPLPLYAQASRFIEWWDSVNNSQAWQDHIFYLLCALYSLIGITTLLGGMVESHLLPPLCLLIPHRDHHPHSVNSSEAWQDHILYLLCAFCSLIGTTTLISIDNSEAWQDRIFYLLCAFYSLIGTATLIQIMRIQWRTREYGWTTQKVFHLLNLIINAARALAFGFHRQVFVFRPKIFGIVFLDLPGLLFFSTYSLLVLFWAEIYSQARSLSTDRYRPTFLIINGEIYLIQFLIWGFEWWRPGSLSSTIARLFLAAVYLSAALGFLYFGGRLFQLLKRFPTESKGRRNKLQEVGFVAAIGFTCFIIRCVVLTVAGFNSDVDVDVLNHPILNLIFYMLVEILPSCLVLFILRKLPQKRVSDQYHPIH